MEKTVNWLKSIGVIVSIFIFLSTAVGDTQVRSRLNKNKIVNNKENIEYLSRTVISKRDLDLRMAILNHKLDAFTSVLMEDISEGDIKNALNRNLKEIRALEEIIIKEGLNYRGESNEDYNSLYEKMLKTNN